MRPEFRERAASQGKTPRNITIDPSGQYLFAANQGSDNIVIFRRDAAVDWVGCSLRAAQL